MISSWWADGHHVAAATTHDAREECLALYGHDPDEIRPWTDEDQAELDDDVDGVNQ